MVTIHRGNERGHLRHDGIDSFHTFSFAGYYDPRLLGFRCLRVLNEDCFASGCAGYAPHPHRNMEILLLVMDGELGHENELTDAARVLSPGDVQGLSTGRGLTHHEFNASQQVPCRVVEAWFEPTRENLEPSCQVCRAGQPGGRGPLVMIASPDGRDQTVALQQDLYVYTARLEAGKRARHFLDPGRAAWIQVLRGELELNRRVLHVGDGASVEKLRRLEFLALDDAELLLMDLP